MLQDSLLFPDNLFASAFVQGWNLGDVCFSVGVQQLLESEYEYEYEYKDEDEDEDIPQIEQLLQAHLWGHAGLASDDEPCSAKLQRRRVEGLPFTSVWYFGGEVIKIVTNQARRITTVCLVRED